MAGPDGKIGHAEIQIGDSRLMLADEFPGMSSAPTPGAKNPCGLFLYLENVDATFNRAVSAGAKVDMPLDNQFWGDRYGKLTIPSGISGASHSIWRTSRRKKCSAAPRSLREDGLRPPLPARSDFCTPRSTRASPLGKQPAGSFVFMNFLKKRKVHAAIP